MWETTTSDVACFSDDIATARNRFLTACDRIGLRVISLPSRATMDNGSPLFCDVARLGSPEVRRLVVLCSAAGGPAGLLGCAAALGVLTEGGVRDLPKNIGLVLIHAANPAGPIWPYFAKEEMQVDGEVIPDWTDGVLAAAEKRFQAFQTENGVDWDQLAGRTLASMTPPVWNAADLRTVSEQFLAGADQVCFIDGRTGPGQYGAAIAVPCDPRGSAGRSRAESWFTVDPAQESQAIGPGESPCAGGLPSLIPAAQVTSLILELGTYSVARTLRTAETGRSDTLTSVPKSQDWHNAAWAATRDVLRRVYRGLLRDV